MTTHLRGYKFINSSQILWGIWIQTFQSDY
jgi:hypothetical protein